MKCINRVWVKKWSLTVALLTTTSLFCFNFSGCKEDTEILNEEESGFVNPMDFVGQAHNQNLSFILNNLDTSDSGLKSAENIQGKIVSLTNKFIETLPPGSILYNENIDYQSWGNLFARELFAPGQKSAKALLSSEQRKYVDELKGIISENIKERNIKAIYDEVVKLEQRVWNSELSDGEKYSVLIAASVGKYSSKFWLQDQESLESYPALKSAAMELDERRREDYWVTWMNGAINCDINGSITGAITGGIFGGIWGSVLLPGVGTITAAIVEAVHGAFYGAVLGSAWYGVQTFYDI